MATLTTTLPTAVQAGKPIAVAFVGAASSVTDSAGNAYTLALSSAGRQIWVCKTPPAGVAPLITVTLSSASGRILVSQHPVASVPPDWA